MNSIVNLFHADCTEFNIRRSEVLRYMQCIGNGDTSELEPLIDSFIDEFNHAADYKACYAKFDINIHDDCIDLGFMQVNSNALSTNLKDCCQVYAFAATTGINAERMLNKYNRLSQGKAFMMDAIGSAAIEAFCDYLNAYLKEEVKQSGLFLHPRFSPGYGDFPIEHQPQLLSALDATRKLNLTLTDSCLMIPTKSVTALIGITDTPYTYNTKTCECCTQTDCRYSK